MHLPRYLHNTQILLFCNKLGKLYIYLKRRIYYNICTQQIGQPWDISSSGDTIQYLIIILRSSNNTFLYIHYVFDYFNNLHITTLSVSEHISLFHVVARFRIQQKEQFLRPNLFKGKSLSKRRLKR